MITTNTVASVSHGPAMLIQRLKEELGTEKLRGGTGSVIAACVEKLDQAALVLEEFRLREEQVQTNSLLSDEGKRQEMQKAAREFYDRLIFVSQAADSRKAAAAELRADLERLPKAPDDPIIAYLRGAEIRTQLRTLAQSERMKLLADSLQPQKAMILRAVEDDPFGGDELIPKDYRARLKEDVLQQNQAAEHTRWKTLVLVSEKLQVLANVLDTTMGKYSVAVPSFTTPLTTKADLGMKNTQAPPPKSTADTPTTVEV